MLRNVVPDLHEPSVCNIRNQKSCCVVLWLTSVSCSCAMTSSRTKRNSRDKRSTRHRHNRANTMLCDDPPTSSNPASKNDAHIHKLQSSKASVPTWLLPPRRPWQHCGGDRPAGGITCQQCNPHTKSHKWKKDTRITASAKQSDKRRWHVSEGTGSLRHESSQNQGSSYNITKENI